MIREAVAWIASCRRQAFEQGLDPSLLDVLRAFGGPDPARAREPDFDALFGEAVREVSALAAEIGRVLEGEVDSAQALMFARRFTAVAGLLASMDAPEARILQVGLSRRMADVLDGPPPRALRVRAVADFYYSQAAVLHHRRGPAGRSLRTLADTGTWRTVAPGIRHAHIKGPGPRGPIHANVLVVERGRIEAVDCREAPDLAALCRDRSAVAGVSGGFFLYSEPDIAPPSRRTDLVGLLVSGGEVVGPPVFRRAALLQDAEHRWSLSRLGMTGVEVAWPAAAVTVRAANDDHGPWPRAFNRAWGRRSPEHAGPSLAVVGRQVVAVGVGSLEIPLAGFVLALPEGSTLLPDPGDALRYRLPVDPPVAEAMGAGPLLVLEGRPCCAPAGIPDLAAEDFCGTAPPLTFSQDETYDQNLLPRMAAGLRPTGDLVLVAVDGRNFDLAPGFTLRMTAEFMVGLGCQTAMNLDGGSSKRMVVRGEVVDLPSTEVVSGGEGADKVRPVHSALLVYPR